MIVNHFVELLVLVARCHDAVWDIPGAFKKRPDAAEDAAVAVLVTTLMGDTPNQ